MASDADGVRDAMFIMQQLTTLYCVPLRSAGVRSHLEPSGLHRSNGKHLDGITIVPWRGGHVSGLEC